MEYWVSLLYVVSESIAASSGAFALIASRTHPLPTTVAFGAASSAHSTDQIYWINRVDYIKINIMFPLTIKK